MKMIGNFYEIGKAIYRDVQSFDKKLSRGVKAGVTRGTIGLKTALRGQVEAAGLGPKLAKTWQSRVYPRGDSKDAAGIVYSKAPQIIAGFDKGALITVKGKGKYLAIPTENVPPGSRGRRLTPSNWPAGRLGELDFVPGRHGTAFMVAHVVSSYADGGMGSFKGFKKATRGRVKKGRQVETVVMFILVPAVKLKKLLNVKGEADKWLSELSRLISEEIDNRVN